MENGNTQVFAGNWQSGLILNKEGELYGFGLNHEGRFDKNLLEHIPFERPLLLAKIVQKTDY